MKVLPCSDSVPPRPERERTETIEKCGDSGFPWRYVSYPRATNGGERFSANTIVPVRSWFKTAEPSCHLGRLPIFRRVVGNALRFRDHERRGAPFERPCSLTFLSLSRPFERSAGLCESRATHTRSWLESGALLSSQTAKPFRTTTFARVNEPPCGEGAAFLVGVFAGPAASVASEDPSKKSVLDGLGSFPSGPDLIGVFDRRDEDLAVARLAGARAVGDCAQDRKSVV